MADSGTDYRRSWRYAWQGPDYGRLLPLLARLPRPLGHGLANWRGAWHQRLQRDWAELSVGFPYVGERTLRALREVLPQATEEELAALVRQRYQTTAREEFEGQLAIDGRSRRLKLDLSGLAPLLARRQAGRGLVVVMAHYDNVYVGMTGLAHQGIPSHMGTTGIVEDERVHPALRRFFLAKYAAYQKLAAGGRLLHTSAAAKQAFYEALTRGEAVVAVTDTPARADGPGSWIPWMGRERKLTNSALRMALETNSEMVAMLCDSDGHGRFCWRCSEVLDPAADVPADGGLPGERVYATLFRFLEAGIRADPGKWWSAHLLQDFPLKPAPDAAPTRAAA